MDQKTYFLARRKSYQLESGKWTYSDPEQSLMRDNFGDLMTGCRTLHSPSGADSDQDYIIRITLTGADQPAIDAIETKLNNLTGWGSDTAANLLQKIKDASGSTSWVNTAGVLEHPNENGAGNFS